MMESEYFLATFRGPSQNWGSYLSTFEWDVVGCNTFRTNVSLEFAQRTTKLFFRKLGQMFECRVAYFVVYEKRTSGLGLSPIALHSHYLVAGPPQHRKRLLEACRSLWESKYGKAHVEPYSPEGYAAYYVSKLLGTPDPQFDLELDRFRSPEDFSGLPEDGPYVPLRVRDLSYVDTLVLRHHVTKLPKEDSTFLEDL